jgi:hypothetical protein
MLENIPFHPITKFWFDKNFAKGRPGWVVGCYKFNHEKLRTKLLPSGI